MLLRAYEGTNLRYTVKSLKFQKQNSHYFRWWRFRNRLGERILPIAKQVYIVYRSEAFCGHESQVDKILQSSVVCIFNTGNYKIDTSTEDQIIEEVELTDGATVR